MPTLLSTSDTKLYINGQFIGSAHHIEPTNWQIIPIGQQWRLLAHYLAVKHAQHRRRLARRRQGRS